MHYIYIWNAKFGVEYDIPLGNCLPFSAEAIPSVG